MLSCVDILGRDALPFDILSQECRQIKASRWPGRSANSKADRQRSRCAESHRWTGTQSYVPKRFLTWLKAPNLRMAVQRSKSRFSRYRSDLVRRSSRNSKRPEGQCRIKGAEAGKDQLIRYCILVDSAKSSTGWIFRADQNAIGNADWPLSFENPPAPQGHNQRCRMW